MKINNGKVIFINGKLKIILDHEAEGTETKSGNLNIAAANWVDLSDLDESLAGYTLNLILIKKEPKKKIIDKKKSKK